MWLRVVLAAGLAAVGFTATGTTSRVDAGDGLSIVVPAGWHLTHRAFTPCSDPVERFSVISGREILTLQERLDSSTERSPFRRGAFRVSGPPTQLECCAIDGRAGWVIPFRDNGRAFYAYLYPARRSAARLLRLLDSLRVAQA